MYPRTLCEWEEERRSIDSLDSVSHWPNFHHGELSVRLYMCQYIYTEAWDWSKEAHGVGWRYCVELVRFYNELAAVVTGYKKGETKRISKNA